MVGALNKLPVAASGVSTNYLFLSFDRQSEQTNLIESFLPSPKTKRTQLIFFGDPATFANVSSIFVGFVAGLVYSAAKSAQSAQAKLAATNGGVGGTGGLELGKPR